MRVDGSRLLRFVEHQWKSWEVTGFDRRVYWWTLNLFRIRLLDSFLWNYDIVLEHGRGDSFRKINLSGKFVQAG